MLPGYILKREVCHAGTWIITAVRPSLLGHLFIQVKVSFTRRCPLLGGRLYIIIYFDDMVHERVSLSSVVL